MSTDNIAGSKSAMTPRRTTPIRALSTLFKTPTRLYTPTGVSRRNKRIRAFPSPATPSAPSTPSSLPAVVLQTYSVSTDSIVLTALPSAPFCCHEDLLTMSRAQLESVVRALNARLPLRMQIRPEDDFWQNDVQDDGVSRMSEAEIKKRIEELVGIRAVVGKNRVSKSGLGLDARARVPLAPKAVRTREAGWRMYEKTPWEMEVDGVENQADDLNGMIEEALMGSSPLAGRTKPGTHSRGRNSTSFRLPILQEVNEGGELKEEDDSDDNEERPCKRLRASLGSANRDPEGRSQEVGESRLIEDMDISGSPLLAAEDAVSSGSFAKSKENVVITTRSPVIGAETSEGGPLQRRRSTRIKEIALKRASSVDSGKKTGLKSSIQRSKSISSGRSPTVNPTPIGESESKRYSNAPREFAICLPFTSTPPQQKPDSSAWSAPRILRSNSQRLLNSNQSSKMKASFGRSRSEKYPHASDLNFVTVNRPRYRFAQGKRRVTKGDHSSPAHRAGQSCQPGTDANGTHDHDEKENVNPLKGVSKSSTLYASTLPSALCNFLSPRSRAPSTSTIASTRSLNGGTPTRDDTPQISPLSDGATEHVWEALERMVVDSA